MLLPHGAVLPKCFHVNFCKEECSLCPHPNLVKHKTTKFCLHREKIKECSYGFLLNFFPNGSGMGTVFLFIKKKFKMMKTQTGNVSSMYRRCRYLKADADFYPTPPEATRALLSEVFFDGSIWEPACGDGAIADVLTDAGYDVVGTDLVDRGYGTGGVNFLRQTKPLAKNPPYGKGLADQFTKQSLAFCRQTGGKVAMLLNLSSLCYPKRMSAFLNTPPKQILGLDELICFPNGDSSRYSTSKQKYCWVIWEVGYDGRPEFWWLSTKNFRE